MVNTFKRTTIHGKISDLLHTHIDELSQFGITTNMGLHDQVERITDQITRLVTLTELHPAQIDEEQMQTATNLIYYFESFLRAVNARQIFTDPVGEIGQVYSHIRSWYDATLLHHSLSVQTVWKMIEPVQPDTLNVLNGNQFEAYWWDPVPRMDIEILRRTPGVEIIEGPYAPKSGGSGIGVKFVIYKVDTS